MFAFCSLCHPERSRGTPDLRLSPRERSSDNTHVVGRVRAAGIALNARAEGWTPGSLRQAQGRLFDSADSAQDDTRIRRARQTKCLSLSKERPARFLLRRERFNASDVAEFVRCDRGVKPLPNPLLGQGEGTKKETPLPTRLSPFPQGKGSGVSLRAHPERLFIPRHPRKLPTKTRAVIPNE
jgi:hypothetical protein